MKHRSRKDKLWSYSLLVASWTGFSLTFPAWLLGWVSERSMLGLTLALSWFALILEARTAVHVDK